MTGSELQHMFAGQEYSRERLSPRPGDFYYLHLSDLRRALDSIRTDEPIKILDYGCGSSPYATLFPRADYKRADFVEVGGLDYLVGGDSRVPEEAGVFDLVLSTQVLEHVPEPQTYLAECFRLLRPGGKLFLSTHGLFEDHGCPYDFRRWTADGLKADVASAGFCGIKVNKLTTGARALFFLVGTGLSHLHAGRRTPFGILVYAFRRIFDRFRGGIHRLCDRHFCRSQKVAAEQPGHPLYICLTVEARRP